MASFTTAQKREVIQTQYPTASNVAVSGNVFFAAFPDAGPSSAGSTHPAKPCGSRQRSP